MSSHPHTFDCRGDEFAERVIAASFQRPLLVDFWAQWCGPCRSLAPVLEQLADDYDGAFALAKVDTEAEQALATEHGIRSLPTVRLYSAGNVVEEFMGVQPAATIRALLDRHVARASDEAIGQAQARLDAGDPTGAAELLSAAHSQDPANERLAPALAVALLEAGDATAALALIESLPAQQRESEAIRPLLARAQLASGAAEGEDEATLRNKVAAQPDDPGNHVALANTLLASGQYSPAMDELLEVLRLERGFDDGIARKTLLNVFEMLGADPLVAEYRGKMARILF